ncbi:MAG: YraN family protein [Pseudopedobacter sp.]|nr:YraN family protein [Deinococcales bacterium]
MKGEEAETRALEHLLAQGHVLLERNYRIRGGEIDLITLEGEVMVFTEVKQRKRGNFGTALESVSAKKVKLVRRAALRYMKRDDLFCRFDVIAIEGDPLSGALIWVQDAF